MSSTEISLDLHTTSWRRTRRIILTRTDGAVTLALDPSMPHGVVRTTWSKETVESNSYSLRIPYRMILAVVGSGIRSPLPAWPCYFREGLIDNAVSVGVNLHENGGAGRRVEFQTALENSLIVQSSGWAYDEDLLQFARSALEVIFPGSDDELPDEERV